jgi:aminoglycoside phosphotransferase (APT) family kinase protein
VENTHQLTVTASRVVKRFRSWNRGEPEREWAGLTMLHRHVPGLAPEPLQRGVEDGAPVIVMTRVPGEPLGAAPLTPGQIAALGRALRAMYGAVPASELAGLPQRRSGPTELCSTLRSWLAEPIPAVSPLVDEAVRAASSWLSSAEVSDFADLFTERVFAHADGNIANFVWDGSGIHVVDFEDSGRSDPVYEVADLVEHVSVWLPGLIGPHDLIGALELSRSEQTRLLGFRRLMAVFWLLMLRPGNPSHRRNPPETVDRQAGRVLGLLC